MSTSKKPRLRAGQSVVDTVTDTRSGIAAQIIYDKEQGDFFTKVGSEVLRDVTGPGCKAKAQKALALSREFAWKPVIFVLDPGILPREGFGTLSNRSTYKVHGRTLELSYRRAELSPKPGQPDRFVERPHELDVPEDERVPGVRMIFGDHGTPNAGSIRELGGDVGDHHTQRSEKGEIILPYTDRTWAALEAMTDAIGKAHEDLGRLLHNPDELERIGAQGLSMSLVGSAALQLQEAVDLGPQCDVCGEHAKYHRYGNMCNPEAIS